jgi:hypothetical protein
MLAVIKKLGGRAYRVGAHREFGEDGETGGKVGFDVSRFGRIIENILCKLNFFLDVTRCSVAVTSRGAVCIPSRSDFSDSIVMELAMGVVVADRLEKEVR